MLHMKWKPIIRIPRPSTFPTVHAKHVDLHHRQLCPFTYALRLLGRLLQRASKAWRWLGWSKYDDLTKGQRHSVHSNHSSILHHLNQTEWPSAERTTAQTAVCQTSDHGHGKQSMKERRRWATIICDENLLIKRVDMFIDQACQKVAENGHRLQVKL